MKEGEVRWNIDNLESDKMNFTSLIRVYKESGYQGSIDIKHVQTDKDIIYFYYVYFEILSVLISEYIHI